MEMCRVCLSTEKNMQPLDETFVAQYNILTDLSITLLDGMPQYSCKTCVDTVKQFIEFRDKSIASETTLRQIISSTVKTENKPPNIEFEELNSVDDKKLKRDIKHEIKVENDYESDSILDNFDFTYEEYDGDLRSLVKDEDVKPVRRKTRSKKHKIKKKIPKPEITECVTDKWVCGLCPASFETRNECWSHLEVHKDMRQCKICNAKVNSASQLYAHRLVHVPANQMKCHMCAKKFRVCTYLEYHYRNVHIEADGPKLQCAECSALLTSPKRLKSHILHVHSNLTFICDICSKTFSSKSNIKSHIQMHFTQKSYICDLCGFSCNFSHGLRDHKIRRHSQKKVYCKQCARPFASQAHCDRHKCVLKVIVCSVCGVQLHGTKRINRHMQAHSDVRKYECKRCPAKYKSKAALKAHVDRHDGNRTVHCEFCPAKFYTHSVLTKHRRIHTGEKPYVCRVCNRAFTGRHNLKVHMKVHGEYLVVKKNTEPDINNINNFYDVTK